MNRAVWRYNASVSRRTGDGQVFTSPPFGNQATYGPYGGVDRRPVALRPRLATGLPFRGWKVCAPPSAPGR